MSIDDKPRSGRCSTVRTHENVEKIREIIKDRRRTIEEIMELLGVTLSSFQRILTMLLLTPLRAESILPRATFFFFFSKRDIKGKRFADVTKVKNKTVEELSSFTKDEFKQRFEKWDERLYISVLMQVEITLKSVKGWCLKIV
ncbi:HTH_48 domain-containing protein [Trichonephila clavipes]|nr:HTH_48 domain-containing protein [Trichonephila clavipes]